ncbi:hypothetical protein [Streptomyces sp. BRA346]|uniref:hypothetical protein n=1 Tax=Streptomyces sp. BRA346 TaxID=2878199 RepID=UPI0040642E32
MRIDLADDIETVPEIAVKDAILEDLSFERVEYLGAIPQPSPQLAHQLEDLIGIGS